VDGDRGNRRGALGVRGGKALDMNIVLLHFSSGNSDGLLYRHRDGEGEGELHGLSGRLLLDAFSCLFALNLRGGKVLEVAVNTRRRAGGVDGGFRVVNDAPFLIVALALRHGLRRKR